MLPAHETGNLVFMVLQYLNHLLSSPISFDFFSPSKSGGKAETKPLCGFRWLLFSFCEKAKEEV